MLISRPFITPARVTDTIATEVAIIADSWNHSVLDYMNDPVSVSHSPIGRHCADKAGNRTNHSGTLVLLDECRQQPNRRHPALLSLNSIPMDPTDYSNHIRADTRDHQDYPGKFTLLCQQLPPYESGDFTHQPQRSQSERFKLGYCKSGSDTTHSDHRNRPRRNQSDLDRSQRLLGKLQRVGV